MDRKEYLQRVFQGQINSLKRDIEISKAEIEDLESALRQERLNLEGNIELLKIAEKEYKNATN